MRVVTLSFAKEHKLETKPLTIHIRHIARVIPPFGAKVFMFKVVSGKLVAITRQRLAISEFTRQQREDKQRK